jgi:hypothetical protein
VFFNDSDLSKICSPALANETIEQAVQAGDVSTLALLPLVPDCASIRDSLLPYPENRGQ